MSQLAADHVHDHAVTVDPAAATLDGRSAKSLRLLSAILLLLGAVGLVALLLAALGGGPHALSNALASYHIGFTFALGLALGSMGLVMIFHQTNAGWCATIRRQLENVMSLIPLCGVLFLPILASVFLAPGKLFHWMAPEVKSDPIFEQKEGFLNLPFFLVRCGIYFLVWYFLSQKLYRNSLRQDQTGEVAITTRSRFLSAGGLLAFALTTAFAGFDWLMGLDYHWFSTMFGVYFFAGNNLAAMSLLVIIVCFLLSRGKLKGLVTPEHFHDMGKLVLAFTVFWAYITFSQYFLIWYSNVPEETGWYVVRRSNGWMNVGVFICFGHFAGPFLLLLWKKTKRVPLLLGAVAAWMLFIHAVDLYYIIIPGFHLHTPSESILANLWVNIAGFIGPVGIFLGFVAARIARNPLVAMKDPRIQEALTHKNYV